VNAIACHKCKEYIIIDEETYQGQKELQDFKKRHLNHATGNIDASELTEYSNVTKNA
jgi:hypothetical protein